MQNEYQQTTADSVQPHRAIVRPVLVVDPGNRFTKWVDCQLGGDNQAKTHS